MLAAVAIALAFALATVLTPALTYRLVLRGAWAVSSYRAWAIQSFVVTFGVVLVACAPWGPGFGVLIGSLIFGATASYYLHLTVRARRLQQACQGLALPETREKSLARVDAALALLARRAAGSPTRYRAYARTAMYVAHAIDSAGLTPTALRVLYAIDEQPLDTLTQVMLVQNQAAFLIRTGDREGARRALARVARPVKDPVYEDAVAALEALLLAIDGDPKEAEARARPALASSRTANVVASWQAALAHALAAQGSRDEARQLLRTMRTDLGDAVLARVARHNGPASPLAEAIQAESGDPYR